MSDFKTPLEPHWNPSLSSFSRNFLYLICCPGNCLHCSKVWRGNKVCVHQYRGFATYSAKYKKFERWELHGSGVMYFVSAASNLVSQRELESSAPSAKDDLHTPSYYSWGIPLTTVLSFLLLGTPQQFVSILWEWLKEYLRTQLLKATTKTSQHQGQAQ